MVLAICGDGATSEGDFHEALNFAAVFHLPVVFFVQNNGYAISVPLRRQLAAPSIAHKAIGYGMPGQRVDGNDLAALLSVLGDAVRLRAPAAARVSSRPSPTASSPHTNADDATRYRTDDEVAPWREKDPLMRIRTYLRGLGVLGDGDEAEIHSQAERVASNLRDGMNADTVPDPSDLFEFVYATRTPQLQEQAAMLAAEIAADAATQPLPGQETLK